MTAEVKGGEQRVSVAVVIPFHKPDVSPSERVSLDQAAKILKRYPRIMMVPDDMPVDRLSAIDPGLQFERFPVACFSSYIAHQQFCRSPALYARFMKYEFILFYHLDSYVFRDELPYWCGSGWDYIGAAWPRYEHLTSSKKWYRHAPFLFKPFLRKQGQGGFSLRRVKTFYRASLYQQWLIKRLPTMNEDLYWACLGSWLYIPFKVADFKSSLAFSFDASPDYCYELTGRKLPFGCHAWYRNECVVWRQAIAPAR